MAPVALKWKVQLSLFLSPCPSQFSQDCPQERRMSRLLLTVGCFAGYRHGWINCAASGSSRSRLSQGSGPGMDPGYVRLKMYTSGGEKTLRKRMQMYKYKTARVLPSACQEPLVSEYFQRLNFVISGLICFCLTFLDLPTALDSICWLPPQKHETFSVLTHPTNSSCTHLSPF